MPRLASVVAALAVSLAVAPAADAASKSRRTPAPRPHNVILFVADGLRSQIVTPQTAPTMAALRARGVDWKNSHSVYPTLTTANASTLATGHRLGDTGDYANTLYLGFPLQSRKGASEAMLEDNAVLAELNEHYGGSFLNETALLAAAHRAGYSTAALGKLGPVMIQTGGEDGVLVFDDRTGQAGGRPLPAAIEQALRAAGIEPKAPGRGANAAGGDFRTPGTKSANVEQQPWFTDIATKVLLPNFKKANRPFVMVYWSRDPDGSQHGQGDSLNSVTPGINGPTSMAGIRNADDQLKRLIETVKALGLEGTTDIVITADHGFSTISKESRTSPSTKIRYADVPEGFLPPGFLATDLAAALDLPLYESNGRAVNWKAGEHVEHGSGYLGSVDKPAVVVAGNGGSDLIWLPQADAATRAPEVVKALLAQDYTAAVFVDDRFGPIPGTLPLSVIALKGSALTRHPDVVVSFRSYSTGCPQPDTCSVIVADTGLQQGQGMHGSLGRGDTHNFMAAAGPSFKAGFVDPAPVSNADLGRTLFHLAGLKPAPKGKLSGRVITESLKGGVSVKAERVELRSTPDATGRVLTVKGWKVGDELYFDAAGFPGQAVGVD